MTKSINKFSSVKNFFENDLYLKNRANILIRQTIVKKLLGDIRGSRIVDVGCGDGSISLQFASDNHISLIDGSEFMISKAQEYIRKNKLSTVETFNIDFFKFKEEKSHDVVICIGVVSHVEDVTALLLKISETLKEDGVLIVQFSDINHYYYRNFTRDETKHNKSYGYSLNTFTESEFQTLIKENKYKIIKRTGYSWPVRPISFLPVQLQYFLINSLRKVPLFSFLNSEQILMLQKAED